MNKLNFKVGDKVTCLCRGKGIIVDIDFENNSLETPIVVDFGIDGDVYSKDGKLYKAGYQVLYPGHDIEIIIKNKKGIIKEFLWL